MAAADLGRRGFLGSSAALALGAVSRAASAAPDGSGFAYEVSRSVAEWRAMLSEEEFLILRGNETELPYTSPLVDETREGTYCCRGCDLTLYESVWKVPLDIGWVFFSHSEPDSVLTAIDGAPVEMGDVPGQIAMIEVHCRRCGSHLGHIVIAEGQLVHCINGTALRFDARTA